MIRDGQVRYHEDLVNTLVPIDNVQQHPENYNNGDVEQIIDSIVTDGMYRTISVQRSTGYIVAGNHTWEACKHLDATQIPVTYLDISENTARRIMLKDNRLASLARPDRAAELALLQSVQEHSDEGLRGVGYTEADVEVIKMLAEMPLETDEFAQWPTLSIQLHPRILRAFRHVTREADNDRDRFEVLLRLAGWDGS